MSAPKINVTPLIDVLLVLLIIFMVVAPLRPNSFQAKIPQEPRPTENVDPPPLALVVSVLKDGSIYLNNKRIEGDTTNTSKLTQELRSIFAQRLANDVVDPTGHVIKAIFMKAPRNLSYGNVVNVVDAVKMGGADPIGLEIDRLDG